MRRAISILAMIIFSMNAGMWAFGEFSNDEFVGAYPGLPAGLQDNTSIDQNQLVMIDAEGNPINSPGTGFLATQFDFIASIAVVGDLVTLGGFALDMLINLTFGITLIALKFEAPIAIVVFIGAVNFMIAAFGAVELVAFINSVLRGGGAV